MKIIETTLPGLFMTETASLNDHRGAFSRLYCERELDSIIGHRHIRQVNHSITHKIGAVRGMHFQYPPHAEMKLVRCIKGQIFDVAVDLRSGSPTFLKWHGEELTPDNARMLAIPEGFAHGFQALKGDSELLYLHTAFYAHDAEGGIRYDEPRIGIDWPEPVNDLSERDSSHTWLSDDFSGIVLHG